MSSCSASDTSSFVLFGSDCAINTHVSFHCTVNSTEEATNCSITTVFEQASVSPSVLKLYVDAHISTFQHLNAQLHCGGWILWLNSFSLVARRNFFSLNRNHLSSICVYTVNNLMSSLFQFYNIQTGNMLKC